MARHLQVVKRGDRHMDHATWEMSKKDGVPKLTLNFAKDPFGVSSAKEKHEHMLGAVNAIGRIYEKARGWLKPGPGESFVFSGIGQKAHYDVPEMKIVITGRKHISEFHRDLYLKNKSQKNNDYLDLISRGLNSAKDGTFTIENKPLRAVLSGADTYKLLTGRAPDLNDAATARYSMPKDEVMNADEEYAHLKSNWRETVRPASLPAQPAVSQAGSDSPQMDLPGFAKPERPDDTTPAGSGHSSAARRAGSGGGGRRR